MQRSIPLLAVLLVLQLGVAGALAVRKDPLSSSTPQTPLVGTAVESADHVVIEGAPAPASGGSSTAMRVEFAQQNGKWILPAYFNAPADNFKLTLLLGKLAALQRGLPIATSPAALRRFKVVDDDFERRVVFSKAGKTLDTLYFGSSPGVRKSDARTARDHAVYAVDLAAYELPTQASDWFDGNLLQRDPIDVTGLDVSVGSQPSLKLVRQPKAATASASGPAATWVDLGLPAGKQIDSAHADTLAHEVAQLHVDAVLGVQASPQWQQQHPALTLQIRDNKHPDQSTNWTLSKSSGDDYYVLKDSARPWYFRVNSTIGKQLLDASALTELIAAAGQKSTESINAKPGLRKTTRSDNTAHVRKTPGAA